MDLRVFARVMAPPQLVGQPHVTITHGIWDPTLPVACSRDRIVPQLRKAGYDVTYEEFHGFHMVPKRALKACVETVAV